MRTRIRSPNKIHKATRRPTSIYFFKGKELAIGLDFDEYLTAPENLKSVILTSAIKRYDIAVSTFIQDVATGRFTAGEVVFGAPAPAVARSGDGQRWVPPGRGALHLALFVMIAAGDGSGMSRVLFLLLPFTAYFAFGRAVAVGVGVACVGLVATTFTLTVPQWTRSNEHVSDLLMFAIGLVLTIATASVASNERRARAQVQVVNAELRASADRVAELSASTERNRVARDIHDGLGHHLTAISVLLEKAAAFRDRDAATADRAIEDARASARRALEDVRRSVSSLREADTFRLGPALDELARQADDGRLTVTVDCSGDESRYPPETLMALYRAAQEGLTNVRRHAQATLASVTVHCAQSEASLVVVDDGEGFTLDREGFGLRGMRERVELSGGTVTVQSRPGAGTRLAVTVPAAPGEQKHDGMPATTRRAPA